MNVGLLKLIAGAQDGGAVVCLSAYLQLPREKRIELIADWLYVLDELAALERDGIEAAKARPGHKQAAPSIKYWRPCPSQGRARRYGKGVRKTEPAVVIDVSRYRHLSRNSAIEMALIDYPTASYLDIEMQFGCSRSTVAGIAKRAQLNVAARHAGTFGGGGDD